jgi:hypothetical protein
MAQLHTLPQKAQDAIVDSLTDEQKRHYNVGNAGAHRYR